MYKELKPFCVLNGYKYKYELIKSDTNICNKVPKIISSENNYSDYPYAGSTMAFIYY